MLNSDQLHKLGISADWVDPLNATFQKFGIDDVRKQAAFIGQCSHESGHFRKLEENLNYSAETLQRLFGHKFKPEEIQQYAHQPQRIANRIYCNRMGNRDEASGDGYRFRGRGCVQLTGHANYYHAGQALGVDFVMNPDMVATPHYAALTAGWFWDTHKLNAPADAWDFVKCTKIINGGSIGLAERRQHAEHALTVLS